MADSTDYDDIQIDDGDHHHGDGEVSSEAIDVSHETDQEKGKSREDELRELAVNASNEYCKYFQIDLSVEEKNLDDSMEDMLTHLEEFCGLLEMIRTDNNVCLEQVVRKVHEKSQFIERIYEKIDRLGEFVEVVKGSVEMMEDEVNKAEQIFGEPNKVKKFFASIIPSKKLYNPPVGTRRRVKFDPPEIFNTDDYLRHCDVGLELVSQDEKDVKQEVKDEVKEDVKEEVKEEVKQKDESGVLEREDKHEEDNVRQEVASDANSASAQTSEINEATSSIDPIETSDA